MQNLRYTKLNLQEVECQQRKRNSELEQSELKTAGLLQQIETLNAEKAAFEQHMGELTSQIQQLQDDQKVAAARTQEELAQKARELYDAQHATDKSNVCLNRSLLRVSASFTLPLQNVLVCKAHAWSQHHPQLRIRFLSGYKHCNRASHTPCFASVCLHAA